MNKITEIVFATKNAGKLKEIIDIMSPIKVYSMTEAGIDIDVVEDGETFAENAIKKATEIAKLCGKVVLSDDSGLEIDYLDKAPGVLSARYLGENTPYSIKNAEILRLLDGVPFEKRTARFVCAIAAAIDNDHIVTRVGTLEGYISTEIRGTSGFGYDPIFYLPKFKMTTAELAPHQKNAISHRGQALRQMREYLEKIDDYGTFEPDANKVNLHAQIHRVYL